MRRPSLDYTRATRGPYSSCSTAEAYVRHIEKKPFVLNIETVNICNAKCVFCPYVDMKRHRGYMSAALYEKIIREYDEIGGGALLLTPILGEFFLDKSALERIEQARRYKSIGHISVTSNGIALNRYTDAQILSFIEQTNFIQISIGGVDAKQYLRMFAVDHFDTVKDNITRFIKIRDSFAPSFPVRLMFRVDCTEEELRSRPGFAYFEDLGVELMVDNSYGNWGGALTADRLPTGAVFRDGPAERANPCFMFYLGLFVSVSGRATACGCMDGEIALDVGSCEDEHIGALWRGAARKSLERSFREGCPPQMCRSCCFYQDGEDFIRTDQVMAFEPGRFPFGY